MNAESKCNCQYCNGHIAFPSEMAGQSINCPHCQLETLLFIQPVTVSLKKTSSVDKIKKFGLVVVLAVAAISIWFAICFLKKTKNDYQAASNNPIKIETNTKPEITNLKPVIGAFGWKLGDKLPAQLKSEVKADVYGINYDFIPDKETPLFKQYCLILTDDGTICCIRASGSLESTEDDAYKNALISLLSEKYGRRPQGKDFSLGVGDDYFFGSDEQTAHLNIYNNHTITLDYTDTKLDKIAYGENVARGKKDELEKKAIMSKGL